MSDDAPWTWYFDHPWRGIATIALHTFNLTDQDLLFTYSRDLVPWYRIPLGILNHAIVALGAVGLVLFGRRAWAAEDPRERDGLVVLLALLAAHWAVYAWTGVEMRFRSVILLILFPFACMPRCTSDGTGNGNRWPARWAAFRYVALALPLSGRRPPSGPAIHDATADHTSCPPPAPTSARLGARLSPPLAPSVASTTSFPQSKLRRSRSSRSARSRRWRCGSRRRRSMPALAAEFQLSEFRAGGAHERRAGRLRRRLPRQRGARARRPARPAPLLRRCPRRSAPRANALLLVVDPRRPRRAAAALRHRRRAWPASTRSA